MPLRALTLGHLLTLRALTLRHLLALRALLALPLRALLALLLRMLLLRALLALARPLLVLGWPRALALRTLASLTSNTLLRSPGGTCGVHGPRIAVLWGSLSLHLSLRRRRLRGHRIRRTLAVTALLFGRRVLREDIVHKRILSRAPAWGIGARLRGLLIVGHRRTLRGVRYGWSVSSV